MITAGAAVLAAGGALLLAAAGLGHVRHQRRLRAVLRVQRVLPPRLHGAAAALTTAAELLVGPAVLALLLAAPAGLAGPLAAQGTLYAGFAGHLGRLRRRRPGVPCGCFGSDGPVTGLLVARAGVLAVGAVAAALLAPEVAAMAPADRLLCVAGGAVVAMAAWLLGALPALPALPAGGRPVVTTSRRPGLSGSLRPSSGRRS